MYNHLPRGNLFSLQSCTTVAGWPSPYDIFQDPHGARVVSDLWMRGHEGPHQPLPDFQGGLRVPAVRLLGATYYGATFKVPRDAECPAAVCILSCYCLVAEIGDQTGLSLIPWMSAPTPRPSRVDVDEKASHTPDDE